MAVVTKAESPVSSEVLDQGWDPRLASDAGVSTSKRELLDSLRALI